MSTLAAVMKPFALGIRRNHQAIFFWGAVLTLGDTPGKVAGAHFVSYK
jgi:hypothetical protein